MPIHSKIHIRFAFVARSIASRLWQTGFAVALILSTSAQAETSLLMFEEVGCVWCARWNAEVGPEYPITPEGLAAPLVRLDIHEPLPDDLSLTSRPRFTPTFILVEDGAELGRIEGYPGEDFFWGLLGRMLERTTPQN